MIQLRVRTEFSYRAAFGPVPEVVARLKTMGTPAAAIVDEGTWGHVRWARACRQAGIRPMFGTELRIKQKDGREPKCWIIAKKGRTREFYRLSTAARVDGADVEKLLRSAKGLVWRFAGAALTDPKTFDFIDINPGSPLQLSRALALREKTKKPLVVTSDNAYAGPEDRAAFLGFGGRERVTPQHILSADELAALFPAPLLREAIRNAEKIAADAADELPSAPLIKVKGDFRKMVETGRKSRLNRGHLSAWPKAYAERLKREIEAIEAKDYQSYFLVVADLVNWAKGRMLVGPGRGSSAGSLLCYLVGITEVDPIPHGLLFERFIDLTRKDLPDIDIDFADTKRDLVFTYLAEKYGKANIARIGNISTLKARSVIARAVDKFQIPQHEKFKLYDSLIEYLSGDSRYGKGLEDTLTQTDAGRSFASRFPEALVMTRLENHADHTSVHAAGVIVSNEPVSDYCTVNPDGVAQVDKPDAESLNLLKIDALGLRTLGVMEDAGCVAPEELYSLKLDDPKVLDVFNAGKFSAIFQFEGPAQRQVASEVVVDNFRIIDHITALARPGPLGGGAAAHYVHRKAGRERIETRHPRMGEILEDTYGVALYQEQVMRIVRELGGFSWEDTTVIRKAMSGRKGIEFFNQKGEQFVAGCQRVNINEPTARAIWQEICNFGAWGMNRAHTCSYAVISYWCAWFKVYHPLEFGAACLRGAKDDAQTLAILREMGDEGFRYVPFDIDRSDVNWKVIDGEIVGGFMNLVGVGPSKAAAAVQARSEGRLDRDKYLKLPVKFADLFPLRTAYRGLYEDPEANGCAPGSEVLTSNLFPNEPIEVLYIGKLVEKKPADANEAVRVARRGGKRYDGPTQFLDLMCRDDMGETIICRIDRFNWETVGRAVNEALSNGDDLLIRGRRVPNFKMLNVIRLKCLNKDGLGWSCATRRRGWE